LAGAGFYVDGAAEFLGDDAMDDFEAEAGAGALRLGGEEGFEDVGKGFRGNAWAVILDADGQLVGAGFGARRAAWLDPGLDADLFVGGGGVEGVVDEVGPDLAERGAAGVDDGGAGREFLFDLNALDAQLVAEDGERTLQAVMYIDLFGGRLLVVGKLLDRHHQF